VTMQPQRRIGMTIRLEQLVGGTYQVRTKRAIMMECKTQAGKQMVPALAEIKQNMNHQVGELLALRLLRKKQAQGGIPKMTLDRRLRALAGVTQTQLQR